MALYQERPRPSIEARKLTAANAPELAYWCGGVQVEEFVPDSDRVLAGINVLTLQGPKRASEGDYIIRTARGGFDRMNEYDFNQKYELA